MPARLFFTSRGRTAIVAADGSGLRYFDFDIPGQATWQVGGFFSDGRRVLFLSMEPRRDGPGRPFDQYYHQTPTHLWICDLDTDALEEIAARPHLATFVTPQLLLDDRRLLVQAIRDGVAQTFTIDLDGGDAREVTRPGEGMPYGFSLNPDRQRLAFHLAGPEGYRIWTSDLDGGDRTLVAADDEYLYFGPSWSPDGQWLAYQGCLYHQDPGHDWSDLFLARPDGSERRQLTRDQALWFGATFGSPATRGGGSNLPAWSPDGAVLVSRRLPGSRVAWEYRADQPDVDHFNRRYRPGLARGGTEICRIDPADGSVEPLTSSQPPVWDFRQTPSPDGALLAFCRAATGGAPAIWVADGDGANARELTTGLNGAGADHPRWMP